MEVVLLTAGVVGTLMAAMAVGVMFKRKPLQGSCGGVAGRCACAEAGSPGACEINPDDPPAQTRGRPGIDGVVIHD